MQTLSPPQRVPERAPKCTDLRFLKTKGGFWVCPFAFVADARALASPGEMARWREVERPLWSPSTRESERWESERSESDHAPSTRHNGTPIRAFPAPSGWCNSLV